MIPRGYIEDAHRCLTEKNNQLRVQMIHQQNIYMIGGICEDTSPELNRNGYTPSTDRNQKSEMNVRGFTKHGEPTSHVEKTHRIKYVCKGQTTTFQTNTNVSDQEAKLTSKLTHPVKCCKPCT